MNFGLAFVSPFFDRKVSHSCTAASTVIDFCRMGTPHATPPNRSQAWRRADELVRFCSGLESPLVLPLPDPLPIDSSLGLRPVELAPQEAATLGGVTICFISDNPPSVGGRF